MARDVKVEINKAGAAALLKSPGIGNDLLRRARRIAAVAGPGMVASGQVGRTRARAGVVTATAEAMAAEARERRLTRALDAGRG